LSTKTVCRNDLKYRCPNSPQELSWLAGNGMGLCEEAELEAQMFGLAQMFIRNPNVQFSTEPAFLQNPC
jgi:hypothetical protein